MENTATTGMDQIATLAAQMDAGTIPTEENNGPIDQETEKAVQGEAERLAAKFAEVARRNAMLRKQKAQVTAPLKEKESEIEKMRQELERLKKYEEVNDPMELLKLKGISYEDLITRNLDPESFDTKSELQKMREEFENYKKSVEEEKRTGLEKQKESVKANYLEHLKSFAEKAGEKYEMISTFGAHQDVYDVIEETFNKTGKVITDEEACDLVEQFLEQNYLDRFAKINKLKSKIAPIRDDLPPSDPIRESQTLTNQLTPQSTATKSKFQNEEDELKWASSFIKWNND
jgi:hypothetical protein